MSDAWNHRQIRELAPALAGGEVSPVALTEQVLARAAASPLHAFTTLLPEQALAEAETAAREIADGHYRGPLHGIPVSVKDLFLVAGAPTTAAAAVTARTPSPHDAPVVAKLRAAGAVVLGTCNLPEFAFGTTGEDSAFGPTLHPLDTKRSPGGSSSGSAVSVAAGLAFASLGTDTGGSVRIPAAACGLVGLKPTAGEITCAGVIPLAPSLDHVGPLTRSVADARIVYHAIRDKSPSPILGKPTTGRLGCPRPYFFDLLDTSVRVVTEQALTRLTDAGWLVTDTPIAHAADTAVVCLHLVLAEAAAMHAEGLAHQPEDYTQEVRLRLELGRYVQAEDYGRAERGRQVLTAAVDAALKGQSALALPALAIPAHRLGTEAVDLGATREPLRNAMLRLTQLFNATGHPAVSIPCGTTPDGLPVGLQLVGRRHQTDQLLAVAEACEAVLG